MQSVATDCFTMVGVPKEARECKKFAEITLPLVSVGRLCVHGMIVAFDDTSVYICNKDGAVISKGRRDPLRNLYMIPIESGKAMHVAPGVQATRKQNNNIIECRATARLNNKVAANAYEIRAVPALIAYLHACAGYIPKETWIKGINNGYYAT